MAVLVVFMMMLGFHFNYYGSRTSLFIVKYSLSYLKKR